MTKEGVVIDNQLTVSVSPHIKSKESTTSIMRDVLIALLPAVIAGVVFFGYRALLHVVITVAACMLAEWAFTRIMKQKNTLADLSAAVTGVLLALNLPVAAPLWVGALGGVIAIIVVKQFFGGLGQNFMNPAMAARVVLMLSFPVLMTTWTQPFAWLGSVDAISSATPLPGVIKGESVVGLFDLFIGKHAGCIGETSALALLLGGIYLLARRVITWHIPVTMIATVALFSLAVNGAENVPYSILSGGVFLGAIFMATDYVTSPMTKWGQVIFGIGIGLIASLIRFYASAPEGVSFAILLMNILTPQIDRLTMRKGVRSRG